MRTIKDRRPHISTEVAVCALLLTATGLTGCGGAIHPAEGRPIEAATPDAMTPTAVMVNEWIEMIETAGMTEYAQLGRELLAQGRVRIVSPPALDAGFNAFAHINTREIWINTPMFDRYPEVLDRATIFLHELIHIRSGEITHNGPWWSAQNEFRVYYHNLQTSAAARPRHDAPAAVSADDCALRW
ncbi:MAG: hypothetical protein ACOX9R_17040 [Armatimonadota bacterium]|jgi:hypothetical protein